MSTFREKAYDAYAAFRGAVRPSMTLQEQAFLAGARFALEEAKLACLRQQAVCHNFRENGCHTKDMLTIGNMLAALPAQTETDRKETE